MIVYQTILIRSFKKLQWIWQGQHWNFSYSIFGDFITRFHSFCHVPFSYYCFSVIARICYNSERDKTLTVPIYLFCYLQYYNTANTILFHVHFWSTMQHNIFIITSLLVTIIIKKQSIILIMQINRRISTSIHFFDLLKLSRTVHFLFDLCFTTHNLFLSLFLTCVLLRYAPSVKY